MINLQNHSIIDKKNFYKIVLFVLFCVAMGIFYKIFFHPKASISDTNSYIQESKVIHLQDVNMVYVSENLHSPYGYKLGTFEQYYYYQTVLYSPKMDKYFALRCYECFYPEYLYAPDLLSGIDDLETVSTIMSNIHRPNIDSNKEIFLMVNIKELHDNTVGTSRSPIPVLWYYQDVKNKTQFVKHNPEIADTKPPYVLQKKFGSLYDAFGKHASTDNFQYFYNVFSYLTYHKSVD